MAIGRGTYNGSKGASSTVVTIRARCSLKNRERERELEEQVSGIHGVPRSVNVMLLCTVYE